MNGLGLFHLERYLLSPEAISYVDGRGDITSFIGCFFTALAEIIGGRSYDVTITSLSLIV